MVTKRRRLVATAMAVGGLLTVRASGSGGPPPMPDYITAHALRPIDQAALAAGRPGIVKASAPAPILYLDWRLLNGLGSGTAATRALATPCCGNPQDRSYDWIAARRAVPGASTDIYYIATERQGANFAVIPTCFGDAFDTAIATLKDRIARHGAGSAGVRAWLAGQDAVFAACSKPGVSLPPLAADAPGWLRADRAYQSAAIALYDSRLDDAARAFAAIGRDPQSAWQPLALYLQARVILQAARSRRDAATFTHAHAAITQLEQAPAGTYGKGETGRMRQLLEYREHPAALLARLDRDLNGTTEADDIAVKFKDYATLSATASTKPEAADWIATIGSNVAQNRPVALAHATDRWRTTRRTAWLVAALSLVMPAEAGAPSLAQDAQRIRADDPAWLSVQYHAIRLAIAHQPAETMRRRVDAILARSDLSLSDRNIFLAIRAQLSPTLADFAAHALRQPYCDGTGATCIVGDWPAGDGLIARRGAGYVGLGGDARVIIDRLPLADRLALGRDPAFPRDLRLDLTLTNYARAVLLRNDAAVDETARALATLLPQVRADWRRIVATPTGPDKRFAEIFVMAKIPSLRTDLADYTRPQGNEPSFGGYWVDWLVPAAGHRTVVPAFPPASTYMPENYWGGGSEDGDDGADLACAGKCGAGRFAFHSPPFAVPHLAAARRERTLFRTGPDKSGATSLWDAALAYVAARPRDARAGETLYRLIRVARWGGNHHHLGKRAFSLLHARYPKSRWARRSPYYYDN